MKRLEKKALVVLLTFITALAISAENQFGSIRRIGLEQGLPNATVPDIAQDTQGFLWFATKQGLSRFDGQRFVTYNTANSSLSGNELNTILVDPKRPWIWVGTERDGLNVFDYEKRIFRTFKHDVNNRSSILSNEITHIALDIHKKGLWIATYRSGIDYYDFDKDQFIPFTPQTIKGMPADYIWAVGQHPQGSLYIGYLKSGLTILSLRDQKVSRFIHNPSNPTSIPNNEILCLFFDPKGNVWVGTRDGLALFNPSTGQFRSFRHSDKDANSILSNQIYGISYKAPNELWVTCRMRGISVLNLQQDIYNLKAPIRFQNISVGDSEKHLSSIHVYSVFTDSFKNTWIGFDGDGLNCIPHEKSLFRIWCNNRMQEEGQRLRGHTPLSLCSEPSGDIWVGEDAAGVDIFHDGENTPLRASVLNNLLGRTLVQSLYKDSKGIIWIGTFLQGIICYSPRTGLLKRLNPDKLLPLHIRCFHEDKNGIMWIGTHHGLYQYDPRSEVFTKSALLNKAIGDNILRSIVGDAEGNIWVGSFGNGLTVFSPSGLVIQHWGVCNGFPTDAINVLYRDSRGDVWAGTRKGLVHFETKKLHRPYHVYNEYNGIANGCIRAIQEDSYKNLWFSTNDGISCLHRSNGVFYNYASLDGFSWGEFQDGASTSDKDGRLYFASRRGVVSFNPSDFNVTHSHIKIAITGLYLLGRQDELQEKSIPITLDGRRIKLDSDENTLSILFSALDYSWANRLEFAYQLEGLSEDWYNCKGGSVTFRNLPSGNYSFHLKYRLSGEKWMQIPTSLNFQIVPPWWKSIWASSVYIITIIGFLYGLFFIKSRRLRLKSSLLIEQEKHRKDQEISNERLMFFTNIAHELRTPLTLILAPLDDLRKEGTLLPSHQSRIALIYRNASRLRELVNQILEFRKTETRNRKLCVQKSDVSDVVKDVVSHFAEYNKKKHVNVCFEKKSENTVLWFDKEVITIILNNLFSNALKYTEQGEVIISLADKVLEDKMYLEFCVKDTGYGIPSEALPYIFERYYQAGGPHQASGTGIGLALIKSLSDLHGAKIAVKSTPNVGSSFFVYLSREFDYPEAKHLTMEDRPIIKDNDLVEIFDEKRDVLITNSVYHPLLLLVEDNIDICSYLQESFHQEYQVLIAHNGKDGVELAFLHTPDVILSDIMMPIMNGFELCKKIKSDVRTSHIPVILLTAKDSDEDQTEGYGVGADSYLRKPFSTSLLKARVSNLLYSRQQLVKSWKAHSSISSKLDKIADKLDNEFLQMLSMLIEESLDTADMDIAFLSNKLHISHSTLYRKTKALTGITLNNFILRIRMNKAAELLATGHFTVLEVMYRVGINTPSYFRKCFKEDFGCLPSEYFKHYSINK